MVGQACLVSSHGAIILTVLLSAFIRVHPRFHNDPLGLGLRAKPALRGYSGTGSLNMLQQFLFSCALPALSGAALLLLAFWTTRRRKSRGDALAPDPAWRWAWGAALVVVLGASLLAQEGFPDRSSLARWHAILPAAAAMALAGALWKRPAFPRIGRWAGPVAAALLCGGLAWMLPDTGGLGTISTAIVATALGTAAVTRSGDSLPFVAHAGSFGAAFASMAAMSLEGRFAKLSLICAALAGFCWLGGILAVGLRVVASPAVRIASLGVVACCALTGFSYTGETVPAGCWIAGFVAAPTGSLLASRSHRRGLSRGRVFAVHLLAVVLLAASGWAWVAIQQAREDSGRPAAMDAAYG